MFVFLFCFLLNTSVVVVVVAVIAFGGGGGGGVYIYLHLRVTGGKSLISSVHLLIFFVLWFLDIGCCVSLTVWFFNEVTIITSP